MKFMRKAPRKEKGGLSRPGLIEIWQARDRLIQLPAQTKNRDQRRAPNWPAAGPDLSRFSEFERHRGCGFTRLGDPQWRRQETAPRPGAIRWRKAYTFAGRGTSVSCLATYYPRYSLLNLLQSEKDFCLLLVKMENKLPPGYPNWPRGSQEATPGRPGSGWCAEEGACRGRA